MTDSCKPVFYHVNLILNPYLLVYNAMDCMLLLLEWNSYLSLHWVYYKSLLQKTSEQEIYIFIPQNHL